MGEKPHWLDRKPDHEWLYHTYRWRKRSLYQRTHVQPLCERCLKNGLVVPAKVADHVRPHRGHVDAFYLGDLQSLCLQCHIGPKAREDHSGWSNELDVDGWPTDSAHPANRPRDPFGRNAQPQARAPWWRRPKARKT
jgi:hypothetical protein